MWCVYEGAEFHMGNLGQDTISEPTRPDWRSGIWTELILAALTRAISSHVTVNLDEFHLVGDM